MVGVQQNMWWWGENAFDFFICKGDILSFVHIFNILNPINLLNEPSLPQFQTRKQPCIQAHNGGSEAECFTQKEETRDCNTQCCKWRRQVLFFSKIFIRHRKKPPRDSKCVYFGQPDLGLWTPTPTLREWSKNPSHENYES